MDQEPQQNNNQPYIAPNNNQGQPTPPELPTTKKKGMLIAAAVVVVAILGIVTFAMMNSNKDSGKTTNSSPSSDSNSKTSDSKFQNYDVTDKTTGIVFSVSFYKDAAVTEKNGRTFLTVGEEGSQSSIYLGAGKEGVIDCGDGPSTTMRLNGESTTICYKSDNKQYGGYVTTNGMTVQLNLAGQKAISMDEAKTIMESATFK